MANRPTLPNVDSESHTRIVDGDRDGTATVDMGVDDVLLRVFLRSSCVVS